MCGCTYEQMKRERSPRLAEIWASTLPGGGGGGVNEVIYSRWEAGEKVKKPTMKEDDIGISETEAAITN